MATNGHKWLCEGHVHGLLGRPKVLWLLRHKAQADAQNKDGCTPLHFIALVGGASSLKTL